MSMHGKGGVSRHRALGSAILERLSELGVPPVLKASAKAFRDAHAAFESASVHVENARAVRDNALAAVAAADDVLDASVLLLANKMVGAGLGTRLKPFASFTKYSPTALTVLAYAAETKEVRALAAKIGKTKVPAEITKATAACVKNAGAVEAALKKVSAPQAAFVKALGARDALLVGWTKAYGTLRKYAAAAWDGDDAKMKAVFAPPGAVLAPVKKRKAAANGAGAAVNPPLNPGA